MRFDTLRLLAFGPFTGTELDLSGGTEGLHVIYGPNEAGKSSALRAIRDLLFGVPRQTDDNFRHDYRNLRIGAVLRQGNGRTLEVVRRKGNRDTLRAADDSTVTDEAELAALLGGVDAEVFRTMFGIDHQRLVAGGQEILRGGGRVGEVLFSAGSGVPGLRRVQQQLRSEADELFRPRGSTMRINARLAALREGQKTLRQCQLAEESYRAAERDLIMARQRAETLANELSGRRARLHRLERIQQALPGIARWREVGRAVEAAREVPLLADDFGTRCHRWLTQLRLAEQGREDAAAALARLDEECRGLSVPEELLLEAEAVEAMRERLGSHRKAMADLPRLQAERDAAHRDTADLLRRLGRAPEEAEAGRLLVPAPQVVHIQNLGAEREALAERLREGEANCERLKGQIADRQGELDRLGELPESETLYRALKQVRHEGKLEEAWAAQAAKRNGEAEATKARLARLTPAVASLEVLERLAIPSAETCDRFDDDYRKLAARCEALRQRRREADDALAAQQAALRQLELEQAVPSEDDLERARQVREEGWQLVLRAWRGEAAEEDVGDYLARTAPAGELAAAYEASVERADELADRLRREARRVAEKAKLQADCDRERRRLEAVGAEMEAVETERAELDRQWRGSWAECGIEPLTPGEMRAWRGEATELARAAHELRQLGAEVDRLEERITAARRALEAPLSEAGAAAPAPEESLAALVDRAEEFLDETRRRVSRREELVQGLAQLRADLREAEVRRRQDAAGFDAWRQAWAEAMETLGLPADATPPQANEVLGALGTLAQKRQEAESLGGRIAAIEDDAARFRSDVEAMAARLAPEFADRSAEEIVVALGRRLQQARQAAERRDELKRDRATTKQNHDRADEQFRQAHRELEDLCAAAGCSSFEELAEAQRRSDQRRKLEEELGHLELQILSHSGGAPLEEFLATVEAVDADALPAEIARFGEEIARLEEERSQVDRCIGTAGSELARLDGSAAAAEAAGDCEEHLAALAGDVEEYAVRRLALAVLRGAIERFREQNQGPVVARASERFAQLTAGSFAELRVDVDEEDRPILLGVRPNGETLDVAGMSDGTSDQLYLALRLASLEAWLDRHEPLPFIVDDVLLNFDDRRAIAALTALADLSRRMQVIFFTHHVHLVDLARAALDEDTLFVHHLAGEA